MILFFHTQWLLSLIIPHYSKTLWYVYEHIRHGQRSPIKYWTENNVDLFGVQWANIGEWTGPGKRAQYWIGVRNRDKYMNKYKWFTHYSPDKITVYSTDYHRAQESAYSQLLAMFPKTTPMLSEEEIDFSNFKYMNQFTNTNITFNTLPHAISPVIPLHIAPYGEDLCSSQACPTHLTIRKHIRDHFIPGKIKGFVDSFKMKYSKYFDEYNNRNKKANLKTISLDLDFDNINVYCDQFICNYNNDVSKLTNFASTGVNWTELHSDCVRALNLSLFDIHNSDKRSTFLSSSRNFRRIIDKIDTVLYEKSRGDVGKTEQFYLFSGHDSTLAPIIATMNFVFGTEIVYPVLTTNLYFEVYEECGEEGEGEIFVEYYVNDDLWLRVGYEEFKKELQEVLLNEEEIKDFCGDDGRKWSNDNDFLWVIGVGWLLLYGVFIIYSVGIAVGCGNRGLRKGKDGNWSTMK